MDAVANAIASGTVVVAMVDNVEEYKYINCVIMGNLLPPYESLSAEIDGQPEVAAGIYYNYLMSPEKLMALSTILAALYRGKNILIFTPEEESMHFGFVGVFRKFFADRFGIIIGMGNEQCQYFPNPEYSAARADLLFLNNLIQFQEYCMLMPPNLPPSQMACGKIMQSLNYRFNNMQECINYCHQYLEATRQDLVKNRGMFTPVFRVKQP